MLRSGTTIAWTIGLAAAWSSRRLWPPQGGFDTGSILARAALGGLLGGMICGLGAYSRLLGSLAERRRSLHLAMLSAGGWSLAIATYNSLAWGSISRLALGPFPAECVSPILLFSAGFCGGFLGGLLFNLLVVPLVPRAKEIPATRCALALSVGSLLGYAVFLLGEVLAGLPLFWSVPVNVVSFMLLAASGATAGAVTSWLLPSMQAAA